MDSFKIKLPDNVLSEHLEGLSPKSRNFELIRLAMNGLLMEKGVFNIGTSNSNANKEIIIDDAPHNKENSVDKSENKSLSSNNKGVNFGMDIVHM